MFMHAIYRLYNNIFLYQVNSNSHKFDNFGGRELNVDVAIASLHINLTN